MGGRATQAGMDVHARSVAREALRPDAGERWPKASSGEGYEREPLGWLEKPPGPARCARGSGRAGSWMSRFPGDGRVAREVVAVSAPPRSPENERREDGRRDAGVVLREARDPASDAARPAPPPAPGRTAPRAGATRRPRSCGRVALGNRRLGRQARFEGAPAAQARRRGEPAPGPATRGPANHCHSTGR